MHAHTRDGLPSTRAPRTCGVRMADVSSRLLACACDRASGGAGAAELADGNFFDRLCVKVVAGVFSAVVGPPAYVTFSPRSHASNRQR